MKSVKIIVLIISVVVICSSCDIFSTRDPETPSGLSEDFPPATSTDILIDNLINSFNSENYTVYLNCFTNTTKDSKNNFEFIAAADALANYPGLFSAWSIDNETRNIKALFAALDESQKPILSLSNTKYEIKTADSSVFSADYYISIKLAENSQADIYKGSMYLTFMPENNGLWRIGRWTDINKKSDTLDLSWSMLKAKFSN